MTPQAPSGEAPAAVVCQFCSTPLEAGAVHELAACRDALVERLARRSFIETLSVDEIANLLEALNDKIASLQARLGEAERRGGEPQSEKPVLDQCPSCGMSAADQLNLRYGRRS